MSGAARLLLEVYPWLPLAFLTEVFLAQALMLSAGRRARSGRSPRP